MEECKTPLKDMCKSALEHYEQLAKDTCHWNSLIPEAIRFYEENFSRVELRVMPNEVVAGEIKARIDELERISKMRLEYKEEYLGEWDTIMIDYLEKRIKQVEKLTNGVASKR